MNDLRLFGANGSEAIVYGNVPAENELKQIYGLLNCEAFAGAKVRIMPDHHAGAGCVIGFTSPIDMRDPKVVPNVVGVDIGCGVHSVAMVSGPSRDEDFVKLDRHIRHYVPSGFDVHSVAQRDLTRVIEALGIDASKFMVDVDKLAQKIRMTNIHRALLSLGTLGGGNHFIEVGRDEQGQVWLTVHSGSRNFGLQVANYHQKIAQKSHPFGALSWLHGDEAREYLADMRVCQQYALVNRALMLYTIMDLYYTAAHYRIAALQRDSVLSVHNYIDDAGVIRKGAVSAHAGQKVVIPWNMRDGLVIGVGRGNADWNESAPHGAGRSMGRKEAKNSLSVADYKAAMAGIWSSCVGKNTIDEAPAAYKSSVDAVESLKDTVEVTNKVLPVYNFKASDEN